MTDWLKKSSRSLGKLHWNEGLLPLWNPKVRWIWACPNFMNKQMGKQNEQDLPKFLHTHKLVTSSPWRPSAPWRFCFRPISGQAVDDRRYVSDLFRRMRCAVICFTISQIPNSRTNPLPSADSPCLSQARPENCYINPYALTVSIICLVLGLCWCFWVLFKCIGTFHLLHFSLSTLVPLVARCGVVRLDWQTQTCRVC